MENCKKFLKALESLNENKDIDILVFSTRTVQNSGSTRFYKKLLEQNSKVKYDFVLKNKEEALPKIPAYINKQSDILLKKIDEMIEKN